MRIIFFNLNVGSGIEHIGNQFVEFIKSTGKFRHILIDDFMYYVKQERLYDEHENLLIEYKLQTHDIHTFKTLKHFKPHIAIVNEYFKRPFTALYYYRDINPIKIIHIEHIWYRMTQMVPEEERDYIGIVDHVVNITPKPDDQHWKPCFRDKILDLKIRPLDRENYRVKIPWNERKKKFIYIGNFWKLHPTFLKEIDNIEGIQIDCIAPDYKGQADHVKNLNFIPEIEQKYVGDVLNEYQYFVLPHSCWEIFNGTALQANFCGTLPIIYSNLNPKYEEWKGSTSGLPHSQYFLEKYCTVTDNMNEFLAVLNRINKVSPDLSEMSKQMATGISEEYNESTMKTKFLSLLGDVNGE